MLKKLKTDVEETCDETLWHIDPSYCDRPNYHHNYDFEQGVVKLQTHRDLNKQEEEAVRKYKKNEDLLIAEPGDDIGYADRLIVEADREVNLAQSTYRSTKHVAPTSNVCERTFSSCKQVMSDYRRHMGPEKLEAIMLLKLNHDLWGTASKGPRLVQIIMNEEKARLAEEKRRREEEQKEDDDEEKS